MAWLFLMKLHDAIGLNPMIYYEVIEDVIYNDDPTPPACFIWCGLILHILAMVVVLVGLVLLWLLAWLVGFWRRYNARG